MGQGILVIGAGGQIGLELIEGLNRFHSPGRVIAADIRKVAINSENPSEVLDVLDKVQLINLIKKHEISEVYLLAAVLSATAEKNPQSSWQLNMQGLFNILDLAKEKHISKIFWPSSIAVFGPSTPKFNTPQQTVMEPSTVYGISKQAGERWCEYYFKKFGVDVRSIRYPGLIGWKTPPGGGTTDYAVHIFHEAIKRGKYECFLAEDTCLPMMYMEEAIRATLEIMGVSAERVKIRGGYNVAGISFTPREIAMQIKNIINLFTITYNPDFRQEIASSWPSSIDDSSAGADWGWSNKVSLEGMVKEMVGKLKEKIK